MGSNSASISFRGVSQEQVVKALLEQPGGVNCYVSPEKNSWVTIFEEGCDGPNEEGIVAIGRRICGACHCPGIAISLESSWVLGYWLFDRDAKLVDKSYQEEDPYGEEERSFDAAHGLLGNPDMIPRVLGLDLAPKLLRDALSADHLMRQKNMVEFSSLIGISFGDARYSDIDECFDTDEFENWNLQDFVCLRESGKDGEAANL
jgi:hypothetical protein